MALQDRDINCVNRSKDKSVELQQLETQVSAIDEVRVKVTVGPEADYFRKRRPPGGAEPSQEENRKFGALK